MNFKSDKQNIPDIHTAPMLSEGLVEGEVLEGSISRLKYPLLSV